ncbi:DMT family transporter [Anaeromicrobium sediminis]|uniref:EamA domain-containing protein n=1 Tax=Anaeromicrobium sediminis TaxID=1478221 RepID=A0A267MFU3_9FIRM|nr:DMT family transporter [Anaeromicrobium sediminis]PAB57745.1 hypothetical protein CCE28_18150 [Anaeromicrobium sediminis]
MSRKMLYMLLVVTTMFWGASFAVVKMAMEDLTPAQLLFLRCIFSAAIFFVILFRVPKERRMKNMKDYAYTAYLAFIGITGYLIIQYTGLKYTSTVNASLLVGIAPIVVAIYSVVVYKEKMSKIKTIGLFVCIMGIALTITKGDLTKVTIGKNLFGDMCMIINGFMLAAFSIGAKRILKKYDSLVVVAYMYILGTIMMIPVVTVPNPLSPIPIINKIGSISIWTYMSGLYLAIPCSVFGFYIWYKAIDEIGATQTSVFNYINPLIAAIISVMYFNENLTAFTFIGGVCIIVGVFLNNAENLLQGNWPKRIFLRKRKAYT